MLDWCEQFGMAVEVVAISDGPCERHPANYVIRKSTEAKGHDFWKEGVYCTPEIETAIWYARPHKVFISAT